MHSEHTAHNVLFAAQELGIINSMDRNSTTGTTYADHPALTADLHSQHPAGGPPPAVDPDKSPRLLTAFRNLLTLAFLGSLILPGFAYISSPADGSAVPTNASWILQITVYLAVTIAATLGFNRLTLKLEPFLARESLDQSAYLELLAERFLPIAIVGSAALSLFLELAVIRWQGTIFEFFSFYKNYGLLACFAGLGLGYALARSKDGIPLLLIFPLLAWQFILLIALRFGLPTRPYSLEAIPFREQLNMGWTATIDQVSVIYLLISVVFFLTALAFVPVGQLCGKLMERRAQLSAYGLNLLGSLLGVSVMFLVSFLWTGPIVWFGLCAAALLLFFARKPKTLIIGMIFATFGIISLAWPVNPLWNKVYSPYQLLDLGYGRDGLMIIRAAGHYFQRVRNLSDGAVNGSADPKLRAVRDYYDLAYRIHPAPDEVAIVGAGSGNDVAAALREGAQHIEAIEIDPAILAAGKANHPERPYDDPRVHPVVNDARTFFRTTSGHFDLIVYGLLDSHTLLSHASSVRLDSFVYTVEGIREARSRLKENGVLSLSFSVLNKELGTKFYKMVTEAFDGKEPVCIATTNAEGAVMFVQSKNGDLKIPSALLAETNFEDHSAFYRNSGLKVDVSTDDWPFLYMPRRVYPVSYLVVLGLIVLESFVLYASFFEERPAASHLPFFFLGAGFMLVETKAITEMGLTFGNTWQVIAIAIGSILVMAFFGNAIVARLRVSSPYPAYLLLTISLAAGWWLAKGGGLPSTTAGRLGTAIVLTCPLLFSGVVFSTLLSAQSRISSVMCMNLLGAMCGGILEYNSMYFGFRFLYVLAIGLYAAALISGLPFRGQRSLAPAVPR
jgi:spermidine synthase